MRKALAIFGATLLMFSFVGVPGVATAVYEGAFQEVCSSDDAKSTDSKLCKPSDKKNDPIVETLSNIVDLVSVVAGAVAVIMIIYAGFKFIIANGDTANIATARQTILYAVVGLVVIVSANLIIQFVISKL